MGIKFANNVKTTTTLAINPIDTLVTVVDSSDFPTLETTFDYFYATLISTNYRHGDPFEIVKVTGVSGNELTVERGIDETTARLWASGTSFELRIPRIALDDISTQANAVLVMSQTISANTEIPSGYNGLSVNPTVAPGVTVTVATGSTWAIVGS